MCRYPVVAHLDHRIAELFVPVRRELCVAQTRRALPRLVGGLWKRLPVDLGEVPSPGRGQGTSSISAPHPRASQLATSGLLSWPSVALFAPKPVSTGEEGGGEGGWQRERVTSHQVDQSFCC